MREEKGNLSPKSGYKGVGRFYDLFADNSDIPFFLECARKFGSPILDLAAGTGRISFALAQEGYEVTALEQSPSMLEAARVKLESAKPSTADNVTILEGDMTQFNLDQKFPLIIIPNSIGHAMSTEEQLSTLHCIHDHLVDNGTFILDVYPGAIQYERAEFKENPVSLSDGTTVERYGQIRSDMLRQIMHVDLKYTVRDGDQNILEEVSVESSAALLFDREVDLLLRLSKFEIDEEYGGFDGSSYSKDSTRRILILKKRDEK